MWCNAKYTYITTNLIWMECCGQEDPGHLTISSNFVTKLSLVVGHLYPPQKSFTLVEVLWIDKIMFMFLCIKHGKSMWNSWRMLDYWIINLGLCWRTWCRCSQTRMYTSSWIYFPNGWQFNQWIWCIHGIGVLAQGKRWFF